MSLLKKLEIICEEIFEKWDKDQRSGKLLLALSGNLKRYREDVTQVREALAGMAWRSTAIPPNGDRDVLVWWPRYRLDDDLNLTDEEVGGKRVVARFTRGDWESDDPLEGIGAFYDDDNEYGLAPTLWCEIPNAPPVPVKATESVAS